MNLSIPINRWTVSAALIVSAWTWLVLWSRTQGGDYNFAPAIMGMVVFVGTVALIVGLILGTFL